MTPAARLQAAIEVLDQWRTGQPVEQVLTNWARRSRFAGSGDRAAIRDHVYDGLRRWRSATCRGGAETGRGAMLGLLREAGTDPDTLFTGQGHAPAALDPAERGAGGDPSGAVACDIPDWLWPAWCQSLGPDAETAALALRDRAPVFLRANLLKGDRESALAALARDGLKAVADDTAPTAIRLIGPARGLADRAAFRDGLVELQDAASQAVVTSIPDLKGLTILDYCAGGGGKTLALAAQSGTQVDAHDANPSRMRGLPERAARAGARVRLVDRPGAGGYPVVLADAPCSGSGSWRRDPEGKWHLTEARLAALCALQAVVLDAAAACVAPGGRLVYATCSVLDAENAGAVSAFLARHEGWSLGTTRRFLPVDGPDGFFFAHLRRD